MSAASDPHVLREMRTQIKEAYVRRSEDADTKERLERAIDAGLTSLGVGGLSAFAEATLRAALLAALAKEGFPVS